MTTTQIPTRLLAFVALVLSIGFLSCEKDKSDSELTPEEQMEASIASSEAEAESDNIFDNVFNDVMGVNTEVALGGTGVFAGRVSSSFDGRIAQVDSLACLVVTVTRLNASNPFPVRITLDFGAGCIGKDGRVRTGKVHTVYTGRLIHPGSSATTTFENHTVDSILVQGTHVVTNISTSAALKFTVEVQNGKLTKPNGDWHQWNSTRTITQMEGMATPTIAIDDVFNITGHAAGVVKHNNIITTWESQIIEPLRKRFNCRWIVKGTVKIIRHIGTVTHQAVLDYGLGTCDRNATITINGVVHQILLRL
jgi:hypothetical protein